MHKCPKCKGRVEIMWGVMVENPDTEQEKVARTWYCRSCNVGGLITYKVDSMTIEKDRRLYE